MAIDYGPIFDGGIFPHHQRALFFNKRRFDIPSYYAVNIIIYRTLSDDLIDGKLLEQVSVKSF